MEKRTLLAVVICMGILFAWQHFYGPKPPPPGSDPAKPVATAPAAGQPGPGTAGSAIGAGAATKAGPEERVVLEAPGARYTLSSWGGELVSATLKDKRFWDKPKQGQPEIPRDIIRGSAAPRAPLQTTFARGAIKVPDNAAWQVVGRTNDQVTFRFESEAVAIEKRFFVQPGSFRLGLSVTVENRTDKPIEDELALHVYGKQDPESSGGGFFAGASANPMQMVCFVNDKVERTSVQPLLEKPDEKSGLVSFVAADEKFFTVAALAHPDAKSGERRCARRAFDAASGEVVLTFAARSFAPAAKAVFDFTVFAGPKYADQLTEITVGGQPTKMEKLIDVTFSVLSNPLLKLLKYFHALVGNWGVAIIMLTLFVKIIAFYPTQRAMMSGKKMQRLAPEMARIRKEFENDKQRQGVETMALYKKHGVSPVGGCLPSLITMPIWIALFSTLNYAVELHRAPFAFYIHDLSARDPYFITPLAMGAIMFLQMRMSPAGVDPQQQKMMAIMMPIMFTAFSLFLPAGLAIYTLTNSLLAILQQVIVNRMDAKAVALADARGDKSSRKDRKK